MSIATTLILALIFLWLSWKQKFLALPFKAFKPINTTTLLLSNFIIFILLIIFVPPILLSLLGSPKKLAILLPLLLLIVLSLYNLHNKPLFKSILKQDTFPDKGSLLRDCLFALITFAIAVFPYLFINNLFFVLVERIFGTIQENQLAVEALKDSHLNLIAVIILAPLLEEFLFRGLLQNALRQKLEPVTAIIISSVIFAFFHYNNAQGALNIVLIPSLFVFALFLGFIYEKTRSLISSIILHSTFNTISAIYILYLN
jgi:uncharacterized protein